MPKAVKGKNSFRSMQNKYPNEKTKRFHTPAYKKRMNDARRYKRRQSVVPTEEIIARKKWLKMIPVFLGVALLIYLVYFASFLQVRSLDMHGADDTLQQQTQTTFNTFLGHYHALLPERNILFFSKQRFIQVVAVEGLVGSVQSVQKKYWHSIDLTVIQRVPAYLLQTPTNAYVISNDGFVSATLQPTDPMPQGLPIITDASTESLQNGGRVFSASQSSFLMAIQNNLQAAAQTTAQSYTIDAKSSEFITVITAAGYKILLDTIGNASTELGYLQRVLAQRGNSNHLAYVDLRFDPKAYVCDTGQPCAAMLSSSPITTPTPSPAT